MACRASRTSWADGLPHVLHEKEPGVLAQRMPPGHAETHRPPRAASTQGLKRLSPSLRAVDSHCSRGTWLHHVGGLTSRMPASHAQCLVSLALLAMSRGACILLQPDDNHVRGHVSGIRGLVTPRCSR